MRSYYLITFERFEANKAEEEEEEEEEKEKEVEEEEEEVRAIRSARMPGCCVTKFSPNKALKLIARCKLTIDERVKLQRVDPDAVWELGFEKWGLGGGSGWGGRGG